MNVHAAKPEILGLTGIRGIAALMVVLYHFHPMFVALLPAWQVFAPVGKVGLLGVDVFFVLSGLILCHVYDADTRSHSVFAHLRFLWLRLARIYPNHVATLAAMAVVLGGASLAGTTLGGNYPVDQLHSHLAMTHAWVRSPGQEWNYPSWSISTEWFAYVYLFPLAVAWLHLRVPGWVHLAIALYLTQSWLYIANGGWPRDLFPILRILCGFWAGVSLYGVWKRTPRVAAWCQRHATALLLAFLATVLVLPAFLARAPDLMMIVMPLLLLGLTADGTRAARWLGSRPMLWLGRVSYALYLTHAVVERLLEWWLPAAAFATAPLAARVGLVALYWVLLLGSADLLYRFVEEPARVWMRNLRPRRDRLGEVRP